MESPKYEDNNNNSNISAYDFVTCQPETGAHSRPTVLFIPFTPLKEPIQLIKVVAFGNLIDIVVSAVQSGATGEGMSQVSFSSCTTANYHDFFL